MIKIEIIDDFKKNIIKNNIKILLVTSAEIEKNKVNETLKPIAGEAKILQYNKDGYEFFIGKFGNYNVVHIQTKIGSLGDGASTLYIEKALNVWDIQMVVMIGIAFGRGADCNQKIGDILISREIYMYEKCRVKENKEGILNYKHLSNPYDNAGKILIAKFKDDNVWNCGDALRPQIHFGTIASGEKVIDSITEKRKLLELGDMTYIIGGEMEASGLVAACSNNKVDEWIVVKGISDWGDGNKVKNKKENQNIAINNTVSYCEYIFSKEKIFDEIVNESPINILESMYSFPILTETSDIDLMYSYETSLIPINNGPKNISQRQNIVNEIKTQLENGKNINIYGEIFAGKTTIIKLLASQYNEMKYIDLSENNINQIERIILMINKIIIELGTDVKLIIAIDNLPKLNKNSKLYNIFINLLQKTSEKNIKIIFSTLISLESVFEDEMNNIQYVNVDKIEESDVINLLKIYEAPEFMYDKKIVQFIETIGKSKVYIIKQILRFLKEANWDFLNNGFIGVIDGKYFLKTKGEIQDILLSRIEGTKNKELLYRIGCVNTDLSMNEIKQICEIKPTIENPAEILRELDGKFIEFDSETNLYKTNPLIHQISKDNVQNSTYISINIILAQNILEKKTLNPYEIVKCLGLLNQAKEYNKAGQLYFHTLNQMYENNIKDEWGIKGIWKDLELPDMDSTLKLQIRAAQLRYYLKFKINYDKTLDLTIKLIKQEKYEDFLIAGIAILFIDKNPYKFNELLKIALLSENKNKKILKSIQEQLPKGKYPTDSIGIESLLWATIPKNGEIELWDSWVDTLTVLNKEQYIKFKNTVNKFFNIEEIYMYYLDKTWVNLKDSISEDIDKIKKLIPINMKIVEFGKKVEDNFITAISIRNIVIFKCEYLKEIDGFEYGKNEVNYVKDQRSRFIITSMIGKQYYFLKQYKEAKEWLEDNLNFNNFKGEVNEKIWVLLHLSVIYEEIDVDEAYKYVKETLKYVAMLENQETKIRFYMEFLIRCFYLNKFEKSIDICLECVKMLLENRYNIGLVSLFTNNINYFKAYIVDNIKIEETKKDYWKPQTGMTIYSNDIIDDKNINNKIYVIYMNILSLLSFYKRKKDMVKFYLQIYSDLKENGIGVSVLFPNEIRIFLIEYGYIEKAMQLLKIINICKIHSKDLMFTNDNNNPLNFTIKLEEMYLKDSQVKVDDFEEIFIFSIIFLLIDKNVQVIDVENNKSFQTLDKQIKNEYLNVVQIIKEGKKLSPKNIEFMVKAKNIEKNQTFEVVYRLLLMSILSGKNLVNYQINLLIYFIGTYGEYSTEETLLKLCINQLEKDVNKNKTYINQETIKLKIEQYKNNPSIMMAKNIYIEILKDIGFNDILEGNVNWLKENDKN